MSFTYGFYNSVNHDRVYDAQQWSSIFDGLIADGIYETQGDKFIVSATDPASMIVTVGTGRAWFHHTWSLNDSLLPLTLDDSDLVVPRIDVICLETNTNAEVRANAIKILKGIPAANPVAPTLTHSEFVNQYALAEILIPAGATSITQANITNKVGTSACPFVLGVIEVMDIDDIVAQWTAQWNEYIVSHEEDLDDWIADFEAELTEWEAGFKSDTEAWYAGEQSIFMDWFNHMKDQLSEDAAGHLQLEIDDLELKRPKTEDITIDTNEWTLNATTQVYEKDISVTGLTDADVVDLNLDFGSLAVATACSLKPLTVSTTGSFKIFALSIPVTNMTGEITISKERKEVSP